MKERMRGCVEGRGGGGDYLCVTVSANITLPLTSTDTPLGLLRVALRADPPWSNPNAVKGRFEPMTVLMMPWERGYPELSDDDWLR